MHCAPKDVAWRRPLSLEGKREKEATARKLVMRSRAFAACGCSSHARAEGFSFSLLTSLAGLEHLAEGVAARCTAACHKRCSCVRRPLDFIALAAAACGRCGAATLQRCRLCARREAQDGPGHLGGSAWQVSCRRAPSCFAAHAPLAPTSPASFARGSDALDVPCAHHRLVASCSRGRSWTEARATAPERTRPCHEACPTCDA